MAANCTEHAGKKVSEEKGNYVLCGAYWWSTMSQFGCNFGFFIYQLIANMRIVFNWKTILLNVSN